MLKFIYELRKPTGATVYVGNSFKPEKRYYDHIHRNPSEGMGHGKFYGQRDLELFIVDALPYDEAWQREYELKLEYGLPVGEMIGRKFTTEEANEIREYYSTGETSIRKLAKMYGVATKTISKILHNQTYRY